MTLIKYARFFAVYGLGGFSVLWILYLAKLGYRLVFKHDKLTIWHTFSRLNYDDVPTRRQKVKWFIIVLAAIVVLLSWDSTFKKLIGMHSLTIESEGTYCYYVEISNADKTYVLPGQIRKQIERDISSHGNLITFGHYHIEKVYFSNGGYLDFSQNDENYVTSLDDHISLYDQEYRQWYCKIIDEHAYCTDFEETSSLSTRNVVELFFVIVIALYNLLGYLLWDEKAQSHFSNYK